MAIFFVKGRYGRLFIQISAKITDLSKTNSTFVCLDIGFQKNRNLCLDLSQMRWTKIHFNLLFYAIKKYLSDLIK